MSADGSNRPANRPIGIFAAGLLMVIFGILEVATAFTGHFLGGISVTTSTEYTAAAAASGSCYTLAGLSVLTMRRAGAAVGIVLICAELLGRAFLASTGLYPLSGIDESSFIAGSIIAVLFIFYIAFSWKRFR